jgi:hypothetical protein
MNRRRKPSCAVRETHATRLSAFLTDPRSYPEKPAQVHMVETHASYGDRKYRDRLRTALARRDVDCCFVEVQASPAAIKRRLAARNDATAEISDARLADFPKLIAQYTRPGEVPRTHHLAVRTNRDAVATVGTILRRLAERQSRRKTARRSARA